MISTILPTPEEQSPPHRGEGQYEDNDDEEY
jgi:hypothetical protein